VPYTRKRAPHGEQRNMLWRAAQNARPALLHIRLERIPPAVLAIADQVIDLSAGDGDVARRPLGSSRVPALDPLAFIRAAKPRTSSLSLFFPCYFRCTSATSTVAKKGRRFTQLGSLTSLAGLVREAATIYKGMKAGTVDHADGRSLVWVLAQMRGMIEAMALERIEARLAEMEQGPLGRLDRGENYGHASANRIH
jgi:hypothetical protein